MKHSFKNIIIVVFSFLTIIFSYLQTNNIIKDTPNINKEYNFNYNDKNINIDNSISILKEITKEKHCFGLEENDNTLNIITSYLDKIGLNYFIQDDELSLDYFLSKIYISEEEYIEQMKQEDEEFDLEKEYLELREYGINVTNYDEYMMSSICTALGYEFDKCQYRNYTYKDYSIELIKKEHENYIGKKINNIIIPIGSIDENKKSVIFSAHYDSGIGLKEDNKDKCVSYGASDDGIHVASLIENARVFKDKNFNNNVYLVLVNGEEIDLYGSQVLIDSEIIKNISLVVNFDNLGAGGRLNLYKSNNEDIVKRYINNTSKPHANSFVNSEFKEKIGVINGSDYDNYSEYYPSIDFALFMDNKNYHTENDTLDNVNLDSFEETLKTTNELIKYFGNDDLDFKDVDNWYLEIANGLIIMLPFSIYNIIIIILGIIFIPYLIYLIIKKQFLKFVINIILYAISIVLYICIKDLVILVLLPIVINAIIDFIKINKTIKFILSLLVNLVFLFIISQIIFKLNSISNLALIIFVIPLLNIINMYLSK